MAGLVATVLLLSVTFPVAWPRGLISQGAVFGASAGLLALGLVLVYRTTRVINLSYGAMGAFAAEVGVFLHAKVGLPWAVCVLVAVVAGGISGVGVDLLLRRFGNGPRLVVTVATIGLLQVFTALQFAIPYLLHGALIAPPFSTGLSKIRFVVGHTPFTGNDLMALALVPVALIGLSWFLLGTEQGTAVRAIAENPDRAMLLGIPINRLSRLVWVIVGVLAAATTILNAPTNGVPVNPFVSAGGVFLPALAAAVVARMESLPVAFGTGVGLGVLDAVVSENVHKEALSVVAFLVVILAALLLQRWDTSRAEDAATGLTLSGGRRSLPDAIASLPELIWARRALLGVIAAIGVALPFVIPASRTHTVTGYLTLGIAVLSVVVLAGWSGTVSLGQYAIVGVGAIAAGDVVAKANVDLFVALVLAAVAGAACALVIGLPALRVRPLFVAVTSLAFAAAMEEYFLNPANYPHWIPGSVARPVLWKRFPLGSERGMYFLCLGVLAGVVMLVAAIRARRTGRVLLASRDNPRGAAALGVPVTRTRVVGMVIAGMVAGVAGGLYAVLQGGVGYESFPAQTSVLLFSMAVVGGLGSISGALCGVALTELLIFLVGLASPQAGSLAPFATGALLLGVLIAFPGGVSQALDLVRDRFAGVMARRHGLELEVGAAAGTVVAGPSLGGADGSGLLSCRSLTASYGSLQVLFGVDLDVADGELVALLGTNGAGKSTVLRAITGLLSSSGSVVLDGASLSGRPADSIARCGLAMMPGGRGVFPTLSVAENLRLACWQLRREGAAAQAAREEMLALFPALAERLSTAAGNLSGGEQQQLSLAMAFVTKPRVLLIDELSLGLAPTIVADLCDKVRRINSGGTTVVVVEQSVNVALGLAERAVFLEKGRVRYTGPTAALLDRPDILRSVFIGSVAAPDVVEDRGVEDRGVEDRGDGDRGVELTCIDVTKRFGGITAVDGVSFSVRPGSIVGLIGHNGAGKTTLFDVISGFLAADGGSVSLGGVPVGDLPPHRRAHLGLGRSFQEARLFPSLTVAEVIMVALDQHLANRDPVAAALALPASVNAEAAGWERCASLLDLLGLSGFADTPTAELSTGTRRIVELACILALDPAVVLLDEPSAGIAQSETEALGPLLHRVRADTGCSMVVIEHDMTLLSSLCDEMVALDRGSVICTGPPASVLAHPEVISSYLGTDPDAVARSGTRSPARSRRRGTLVS